MGVLGGLFFLMTALYITQDRKTAQILASGAVRVPGETLPQTLPILEAS